MRNIAALPWTAAAILLVATLLAGAIVPLRAAEDHAPAMLVSLVYAEPGRPWQQGLQALGYQVKVLDGPRLLTWDLLKQFNVLVIADWAVDPEGTRTEAGILTPALLRVWKESVGRFLAEGGGVLILGTPGQSDTTGGTGALDVARSPAHPSHGATVHALRCPARYAPGGDKSAAERLGAHLQG